MNSISERNLFSQNIRSRNKKKSNSTKNWKMIYKEEENINKLNHMCVY